MRKRITGPRRILDTARGLSGIDLRDIATVEVSSEDPNFPIETVFTPDGSSGWRASQKGEQTIRLVFDQPLAVHRMQLYFVEPERDRTQEFTIAWSSPEGGQPKEIVRQQWNFSPAGSTNELEDYEVNLDNVSALDLVIRPDLTHHEGIATLQAWLVA